MICLLKFSNAFGVSAARTEIKVQNVTCTFLASDLDAPWHWKKFIIWKLLRTFSIVV